MPIIPPGNVPGAGILSGQQVGNPGPKLFQGPGNPYRVDPGLPPGHGIVQGPQLNPKIISPQRPQENAPILNQDFINKPPNAKEINNLGNLGQNSPGFKSPEIPPYVHHVKPQEPQIIYKKESPAELLSLIKAFASFMIGGNHYSQDVKNAIQVALDRIPEVKENQLLKQVLLIQEKKENFPDYHGDHKKNPPPLPPKEEQVKCEGTCNQLRDKSVYESIPCGGSCKICPRCRSSNMEFCLKCNGYYSNNQKEDIQLFSMTMGD